MFMPATEQLEFSYIPVRVKKKKKIVNQFEKLFAVSYT